MSSPGVCPGEVLVSGPFIWFFCLILVSNSVLDSGFYTYSWCLVLMSCYVWVDRGVWVLVSGPGLWSWSLVLVSGPGLWS
jgi:hypothetical protein